MHLTQFMRGARRHDGLLIAGVDERQVLLTVVVETKWWRGRFGRWRRHRLERRLRAGRFVQGEAFGSRHVDSLNRARPARRSARSRRVAPDSPGNTNLRAEPRTACPARPHAPGRRWQ